MNLWGISDRGKVRSQNQDVCQIIYDSEKEIAIMVVCDGMGGAKAGNIASEIASEQFADYIIDRLNGGVGDIVPSVKEAVQLANASIYAKSMTDDECSGMGTTLVAVAATSDMTVVVNIGDSRAYRVTDGGIVQITRDHSVVEDMIMRGDITRSEAKTHPNRNLITRALGTAPSVDADVFFPELNKGEYILLSTDGLTNVISDELIFDEIKKGGTVEEICRRLIDLALDKGAPDNVTVALLRK